MPVGKVGEVKHLARPVLARDDHARPLGTDRDHLGALPFKRPGNRCGRTARVAGNDNSRLSGLTLLGGTQGQAIGLGYNPAGQIASRTGSNDAYAFADHYNVDRGYGVNGLNQYTASGSVVPTYDARGSLTSAGGASWVYNGKNQLTGTSGGLLVYDPAGRLDQVSASGLTWEWDGPRLVTERSGGAIVRRSACPMPISAMRPGASGDRHAALSCSARPSSPPSTVPAGDSRSDGNVGSFWHVPARAIVGYAGRVRVAEWIA